MENVNSQDFVYSIKVPMDRVAVLIGKSGKTKNELEQEIGCELFIDSKEGDATLKSKDPMKIYSGSQVVKAIARGFAPEKALLLLNESYLFELIEINNYASDAQVSRVRSRVIGAKGATRRNIEEKTGVFVSVYGKTIGIIGEIKEVAIAKHAIEMIIKGSRHNTAYKYIENQMSDLIRSKLENNQYFYKKIDKED